MRLLHKSVVVAGLTLMLIPAITSAHFGSEDSMVKSRVRGDVEVNSRHHEGEEHRGVHLGMFAKMFVRGTVTSVGSNSIVIQTKDDASVTVDVSEADLIRLPRVTISLSDIKVGDRVWVHGTRDGDTIEATAVYDISADVKPAMAKGKVTAVDGDNITIETKHQGAVTVKADDNTVVRQNGETVSANEIEVGAKVKVFGLWNKITDFFSAVLIKLK